MSASLDRDVARRSRRIGARWRNPIHGADRILRFFAGILRKNPALATVAARPATINGLPGFAMREDDGSIDTMAIEHRAGRIVAIYLTRNPEKLRHVRF
jgi:RNA polymerase sigma-70 factor, ECF subfamily